jgi:hypothetical protein
VVMFLTEHRHAPVSCYSACLSVCPLVRLSSTSLIFIRMTGTCGVGCVPSGFTCPGVRSLFNTRPFSSIVYIADKSHDAILDVSCLMGFKRAVFLFVTHDITLWWVCTSWCLFRWLCARTYCVLDVYVNIGKRVSRLMVFGCTFVFYRR